MTAIKDAMQKAGFDTTNTELYRLEVEAIRNHGGNALKAVPKFAALLRKRDELLEALVRKELLAIAAGMSIPLPDVNVRGSRTGSYRRGGYQRHRPRSDEERAAALRAAAARTEALQSVFDRRRFHGRALGDFAWGELEGLIATSQRDATESLRLGTEGVEMMLIGAQCLSYTQVSDHSLKVREVIPASQALIFEDQARRRAPELILQGMQKYKQVLESYRTAPQLTAQ